VNRERRFLTIHYPYDMKALVLLSLFFSTLTVSGQVDTAGSKDPLVEKLKELEMENFVKKKTAVFLEQLPAGYKLNIIHANKQGYAYTAVISFPERPYLEIYLHYYRFLYTNPNSFFKKKQRRQLKMEKVSEINIYQEFMCVNGCD
jgi:hypothetical protein